MHLYKKKRPLLPWEQYKRRTETATTYWEKYEEVDKRVLVCFVELVHKHAKKSHLKEERIKSSDLNKKKIIEWSLSSGGVQNCFYALVELRNGTEPKYVFFLLWCWPVNKA